MARSAAEIAVAALSHELERARAALSAAEATRDRCQERVDRLSQAVDEVRSALEPAPVVTLVPELHSNGNGHLPAARKNGVHAEDVLFEKPAPAERTVRYLIQQALRLHDRPQGLNAMAVAAIIGVDKNHVAVELCHLAKRGTIARVDQGRYRVAEAVEEAG